MKVLTVKVCECLLPWEIHITDFHPDCVLNCVDPSRQDFIVYKSFQALQSHNLYCYSLGE